MTRNVTQVLLDWLGENDDKFTAYSFKKDAEALSSTTCYKSVHFDVLTKLCGTRTLDTDNSNTAFGEKKTAEICLLTLSDAYFLHAQVFLLISCK